MYGKQNKVEEIYIRLSYVHLETDEVKSFEKKFTMFELEEFTLKVLKEYENFILFINKQRNIRNESIKLIKFPFEKYREGQRRLINISYCTIKEGERLFVQAPTGIGKTISTIFSFCKSTR